MTTTRKRSLLLVVVGAMLALPGWASGAAAHEQHAYPAAGNHLRPVLECVHERQGQSVVAVFGNDSSRGRREPEVRPCDDDGSARSDPQGAPHAVNTSSAALPGLWGIGAAGYLLLQERRRRGRATKIGA